MLFVVFRSYPQCTLCTGKVIVCYDNKAIVDLVAIPKEQYIILYYFDGAGKLIYINR